MRDEKQTRAWLNLEKNEVLTAGPKDMETFYSKLENEQRLRERQEQAKAFGLLIHRLRTSHHLTIVQLAEKIKANAQELTGIEEGEVPVEPRLVSRLARALNAPPGRLMQMAGHVQIVDRDLAEVAHKAYKYAARSNTETLEDEQRRAIDDLVKVLVGD